MILYVYFAICILHSSYAFYLYGKNYFFPSKDKTEVKKEIIKKPITSKTSYVSKPEKHIEEKSYKTKIGAFQYSFLKNSNVVPISDEIVLNDLEFTKYKKEYNYYLNKYFSLKHLKGIKEIVIADAEMFDDKSSGITESINGSSYIVMASKSGDSTCIVHEACHAFQAYYIDIFNMYYKDKWAKTKKYVSDYAKTNLYEDFAETGTAYLMGDTLVPNPKFKLFADFYNRVK